MATVPALTCDSIINPDAIISSVIQLVKDVINEEDHRYILQTDLRRMERLLIDTAIFFRCQPKESVESVMIWFQLLENSLTEAEHLLDRPAEHQRRYLDCIACNRMRLSKEIRVWKAFHNLLYQGFESIESALSGDDINSLVVGPLMELLGDVINKEDSTQILQTDLRCMETLLQDITNIFQDEHDITTLFQRERKVALEIMNTWFPLLQNSLKEAKCLFDGDARGLSEKIRVWGASFDKMHHGFEAALSILVTSLPFVSAKPLYKDNALLQRVAASASDAQPLSKDEAWTLFRRVAFKGVQVSMDIEERGKIIAEECEGLPLAINVVAATMIGKTSVHEWDICLASLKNVDPSFPLTHPCLDAELYARLRYSYDALPNSEVKRCFLYCAMYKENEEIDADTLLQMWIGEGLVKSKQGTYLMDMAIGRKYLKLLLDRFLFQRVSKSRNILNRRTIRVHSCIRAMAVYNGEKEENCLFMVSQHQQYFPEVHDQNCRRISVANNLKEDLSIKLRFSNLASLTLERNTYLKELPSEFRLSVTSLRVLNLSGCTGITSIPTSIGQLIMLEFLSLRELPIKDLPVEICHLSALQVLNLSGCYDLITLPSQIGDLKNLKHLSLDECGSLWMIPRAISEVTSLSRLQLYTNLSVEMEAPASIWSLKGLKRLTELKIWIDTWQNGKKLRIKDGIMGTWSEMRHLELNYHHRDEKDLHLPEDMQNMLKLQSFMLYRYQGLSLPNCKFEHLEMVKLHRCDWITELSPLDLLPNLKILKLEWCENLRELGMGSPSAYVSLEKLVLRRLFKLESLGAASNRAVWDERTLPLLCALKIGGCPLLEKFPRGMEKLPNLCSLIYQPIQMYPRCADEWWKSIIWENDNIKAKFQKIFIPLPQKRGRGGKA